MDTSEYFEVTGKAGEPISLPIAGGPATGYTWSLELPEGIDQIDSGPRRWVDPSVRLGGASGGYLRVKATHGDHIITARLVQPWASDHPLRVVEIRLHVE
jgi:hypothetical protein